MSQRLTTKLVCTACGLFILGLSVVLSVPMLSVTGSKRDIVPAVIVAPTTPFKVKAPEVKSPLEDYEVFSRVPGAPETQDTEVSLTKPAEVPVAPPMLRRSEEKPAGEPSIQSKTKVEVLFPPL